MSRGSGVPLLVVSKHPVYVPVLIEPGASQAVHCCDLCLTAAQLGMDDEDPDSQLSCRFAHYARCTSVSQTAGLLAPSRRPTPSPSLRGSLIESVVNDKAPPSLSSSQEMLSRGSSRPKSLELPSLVSTLPPSTSLSPKLSRLAHLRNSTGSTMFLRDFSSPPPLPPPGPASGIPSVPISPPLSPDSPLIPSASPSPNASGRSSLPLPSSGDQQGNVLRNSLPPTSAPTPTKELQQPSTTPNDVSSKKLSHPPSAKPHQAQTATTPPSVKVAESFARIPPFHFPLGQVDSTNNAKCAQKLRDILAGHPTISWERMEAVCQAMGFTRYWRAIVFKKAGGTYSAPTPAGKDHLGSANGVTGATPRVPVAVKSDSLLSMWTKMTQKCHDRPSRFVWLMSSTSDAAAHPSTMVIYPSQFEDILQDVVDSHPGLHFLVNAKDFHVRYINTVTSRIFFNLRAWSGRINVRDLRRSDFLASLDALQEVSDINRLTDYFSYEHFYVIYCKFWELDDDHDLLITREQLGRHNQSVLTNRIVDRILSGAVTRGECQRNGNMTYVEFVWFLIAEEYKNHPTSIEYWFRCMDLDGDGYISLYEMEYFYQDMMHRLSMNGIEPLHFKDQCCQMLDMIKPAQPNQVSLSDLKRCQMADVFFNTMFNVEKYLDFEGKDPFATPPRDLDEGPDAPKPPNDWDKYAAIEYEALLDQESGGGAANRSSEFDPDDILDDANLLTGGGAPGNAGPHASNGRGGTGMSNSSNNSVSSYFSNESSRGYYESASNANGGNSGSYRPGHFGSEDDDDDEI